MKSNTNKSLAKTRTGIDGLDEVTEGGFPEGRPTLICGSAGCGKTLLAMQFLVKGITEDNEHGVFMSFEEGVKDLTQNVQSLGFDLEKLITQKKLRIDHVRIERSEIEETGEYDLEGIFVRLNHAIDSIGAKRVVLDTIESLFGGLDNSTILRSELRRLFQWLKDKGVTTIITGERGENSLTRQGLEEYVSDCVILLDFRVIDQIATRRLRIVKYRGSTHGTNEYPFLIDESGISVLPITSLKLEHHTSNEIVSTGLPTLDNLFARGGFFKGSSTLITGSAGTAKTTLSTYFALSSCKRNERVLYFSFEESPEQLIRNMQSVDIKIEQYVKSKLLYIHASRPSLQGLEMHLLLLHKLIKEYNPLTVIVDPISSLVTVGSGSEVRAMLVRLMDMLKVKGISALFTSLTPSDQFESSITETTISSLADTWIKLSNKEHNKGRVRNLVVVKSRGMGHSSDVSDFIITDEGIKILSSLSV
ncbi:circadian clock protein KaiC [Algoriphagus ratkowskyi]|uniref:non-specific serine/threonine protein kinase n=1 Tax=Algoriphagus ratkowskyi TaxID=57028 RepID=A0A2W7RDL7_9BACT|nr:circadian clock protein KaiC [Algoriphagus ratkowskyi]PZX58221.1 circadian clock protein KaiC [Algoriphagus ratkowskyi]TXD77897.1 circadian clock protein KaiC [Algoriphagus ratkowskyi]